MPNRPPKRWFNRVVESLSRLPHVDDPVAIAGDMWHHKMTPAAKKAILAEETKGSKGYDPQPAPKPIDIEGYDGTTIRIVPEVDQLIEAVIRLPKHQYDRVVDEVKDWEDVEVDEKKGRIVRRAKLNKATNIFIDRD